jgi:nucleoside-diphosphate-sugar epimerase
MDNKKAKEILEWSPKTGLSEGIAKEIDWIVKNPNRWGGKPRV